MEEWSFGGSLPNWTQVRLPNTCSKTNLLTQDCGERKYSIYLQDTKQGERAANIQRT